MSSSIHGRSSEADDNEAAANAACGEAFAKATAAMRLTRLFAGRMVADLDASQLRAQIYSRGKLGGGGLSSSSNNSSISNSRGGVVNGGSGRSYHYHTTMTVTVPGASVIVTTGDGGSGGGRGGGVSTVGITEGVVEAEHAASAPSGRGRADVADDPAVALLAALVSLLCAAEERGRESVSFVEGFADVQLEGVGLLLVLLGTQAYDPPPLPPDQRQHDLKGGYYSPPLLSLGCGRSGCA